MDSIDRKILAELQSDGRLSITELAERVNLSLSPCHRRLRTLEQEGVITGYRANLDPAKMGFNFLAIVFATLKEGDKKAVSAFEDAVEEIPQIVLAQRLFGDPDYLMHVVTRDLPAFQKLYDDKLSAMPDVNISCVAILPIFAIRLSAIANTAICGRIAARRNILAAIG